MSDNGWVVDNLDKILTGVVSVVGAVWLAARRVAGIEDRMKDSEHKAALLAAAQSQTDGRVAEGRASIMEGIASLRSELHSLSSKMAESEERTRQFWEHKWPRVEAQEVRIANLEETCATIMSELRELRSLMMNHEAPPSPKPRRKK